VNNKPELEGVARTPSGDFASSKVYHTCGLRSGVCAACECNPKRAAEAAIRVEEGRDGPYHAHDELSALKYELRKTHEQLRASLDREQQLLRERLKFEHQLAVIRCVVCPEGKR
jgi:hypothetical protein